MNNTNEIFETIVETQKKTIDTLVDTTNKFQEAIKSGNPLEKSSEIYQNWWDTQLTILNNITNKTKSGVEENLHSTKSKTEDFYKNLYEQQIDAVKKAAEFNLNFFNTVSNLGKNTTETNESFNAVYGQWNTLFESWTKSLNTTFETLSKSMPSNLNTDLFQTTYNTNTLFLKLQDFYKPYFTAFKDNKFSVDSMKSLFDPAQYKTITEETFASFFKKNDLNTLIESNSKMIQDFFANQKNSTKEYQEFWTLFTSKFPHLFSNDLGKLNDVFTNVSTSYTELFAPAMKLVSNSKEKENIELLISTLDKSTTYNVKLAQIQYLLYTTGQKVAEEVGKHIVDKTQNQDVNYTFQTFFNEWVAINEKHYAVLFGTDEFSKLKAEVLTLSLEVKKNIEKQFETRIEHLPLVVKSEMTELYQTIHDLKKTIKSLEAKVNVAKPTTTTSATKTTTAKKATV